MIERPAIAIIGGTGQEGGGIALRLAHAGFPVTIGSRDAEKAADAADRINEKLATDKASGADNHAAAASAEIVILAVPYQGQKNTALALRDELKGKILVDATVPLVPPKVARVQLPEGGSAVALIQVELGDEVRVVSAFQNVSWNHLVDLDHEIDCDVLVCGDDGAACDTVVDLIKAMGMRGLHAGPIANSAAAEALTSLLISLNRRYKSPGSGIRITGI
jgi:NADPH-dependent F420 reductase